MKSTILILIAILISISSICQEMYVTSDTVFERQSKDWYFTSVIYVDSTVTKDVLYQKSRQWFSEAFTSAKAVIDNADKEEGVIYGKGSLSLEKSVDGHVDFTIEIRCKKGKVKYVLTNFTHNGACVINAYGTCATGGYKEINIGPLTQIESQYSYAMTGRKKDKFWNSIKNQSKFDVYKMITSLKETFKKETLKEKDSW